jgi:hypothetical protein
MQIALSRSPLPGRRYQLRGALVWMTLRVNGDVGFQVVASAHEFPEGGAAVQLMTPAGKR